MTWITLLLGEPQRSSREARPPQQNTPSLESFLPQRRGVAVREFTDSSGVEWRVWNTRPSRDGLYREEYREGWLTFESATERRRLAPIPESWEEVSEERLDLLCRVANRVQERTSTRDSWSDERSIR